MVNTNGIRHGGPTVAQYLRDDLHTRVETARPDQIPEVVQWLKSHGQSTWLASDHSTDAHVFLPPGGYFRRYQGGILEDWLKDPSLDRPLDMESRVTLAFLQVGFTFNNLLLLGLTYVFCSRIMKLQSWRRRREVGLLQLSLSSTLWSYIQRHSSLRKLWPSPWPIAGKEYHLVLILFRAQCREE